MMDNPHVKLYSAIAGAENCAHRLLNDASEMIRNQGDNGKLRELVDKQLLILNISMAALLAFRETLATVESETST